jgi:hypothetical protein
VVRRGAKFFEARVREGHGALLSRGAPDR